MFIRWQSRPRRRPEFGSFYERATSGDWQRISDTHWRAILVENTRVDGKARQRHIAYIAGFTESRAKIPTQRCYLWDAIAAKLDALGNQIPAEARATIEATIAAKLPRPTPAEYLEQARHFAANYGWDYLSAGFRAALADEADRWQGREGDGVARIRNAAKSESDQRDATGAAPVVCCFCGRGRAQVQAMVANETGIAVCNDCIATAAAKIAEASAARDSSLAIGLARN